MSRLQIEITIGIFLVLATSTVVLIYGFNEQNRMLTFTQEEEARAIEAGAGLFETNCSGCHGLKGEGVPGLCPPLNNNNFFNSRMQEVGWTGTLEDYIIATVSSGRLTSTRPDQYAGGGKPAMPAWSDRFGGPLRDDQIQVIAKYIMNFKGTATGEVTLQEIASPVSDDPVVRGELVFKNNGCIGCHTITNISSGTVGPNLTQIGTTAATRVDGQSAEEYIHNSIVNPNAYIVEGFNPDIMPKNFGEVISESDLNDLIAFLLAQK
jgi:mono/diheme cytochrome c family protein